MTPLPAPVPAPLPTPLPTLLPLRGLFCCLGCGQRPPHPLGGRQRNTTRSLDLQPKAVALGVGNGVGNTALRCLPGLCVSVGWWLCHFLRTWSRTFSSLREAAPCHA
jgi:hypothetical protein